MSWVNGQRGVALNVAWGYHTRLCHTEIANIRHHFNEPGDAIRV